MKFPTVILSIVSLSTTAFAETKVIDPNGNTQVDADSQAINYGTTPPWYALDHLNTECSTVGCSGAQEIKVGTLVVKDGHLIEMDIVISAEASFNSEGKATRETLVEIAKGISAQGYEFRKDKYEDCGGTPFCEYPEADQYVQTQRIHIATVEPDGNDAFLNIFITMETPEGEWCEKIFAAAGGIGGAISGVVGGVFALASLAC